MLIQSIPSTNQKLGQVIALTAFALATNQAMATTGSYLFSDLGTVNGAYVGNGLIVSGINNLGQVVGSNDTTPYIWNGNTATALPLPANVDTTSAAAINDSGQIAGSNYSVSEDRGYAIRWDNVAPTVVGTLGGGFVSAAFAINNNNQMAGASWFDNHFNPVRWDGNITIRLETLGGEVGIAGGINDAGVVVGESSLNDGAGKHATLWIGSAATDLGTVGGTNSTAIDINNNGQIIGWGLINGDNSSHAIFWNSLNASAQDLGTLGGSESAAQAINDVGQIVGQSTLANGRSHAVLWNGSSNPTDLNAFLPADLADAGWFMSYGLGINNGGIIIGNLSNSLDQSLTGVFKLTPTSVPVPGAVWLFGSALAGLVSIKHHKQVLST